MFQVLDPEIENFLEQFGISEQSDDVENFLSHYGVRGQKWGVRKARPMGSGRPGGSNIVVRGGSNTVAARVAGFATGMAAAYMTRYLKLPVRFAATLGGVVAGRAAVGAYMNHRGKKRLSEIRQAH